MSQHTSVTVAAAESELVRGALLELYAARATAVAEHAGKVGEERLRELRGELTACERMLDVFGWEARAETGELSGTEDVVGQVLRLALSDAVEAVGAVLERYHHGSAELDDVLSASDSLRALVGRFAAFEREHAL